MLIVSALRLFITVYFAEHKNKQTCKFKQTMWQI